MFSLKSTPTFPLRVFASKLSSVKRKKNCQSLRHLCGAKRGSVKIEIEGSKVPEKRKEGMNV